MNVKCVQTRQKKKRQIKTIGKIMLLTLLDYTGKELKLKFELRIRSNQIISVLTRLIMLNRTKIELTDAQRERPVFSKDKLKKTKPFGLEKPLSFGSPSTLIRFLLSVAGKSVTFNLLSSDPLCCISL